MHTFYPEVPFTKTQDVPTPRYAHDGDAGLDLVATKDVTLRPGESCKMGSGISVAIPKGHVGYIFARSGTGSKGLVMKNGTAVIDSTFRGEMKLFMMNNNPQWVWVCGKMFADEEVYYESELRLVPNLDGDIHIHAGDRIAQLVISPVDCASLVQVKELDETDRGTAGVGSTGLRYERP